MSEDSKEIHKTDDQKTTYTLNIYKRGSEIEQKNRKMVSQKVPQFQNLTLLQAKQLKRTIPSTKSQFIFLNWTSK